MPTITVYSEVDSYVEDSALYRDTNFGASTALAVYSDMYSTKRRTFIKFDLSSVPTTGRIITATMRLYTSLVTAALCDIHKVTAGWGEYVITHNNQPAVSTLLKQYTPAGGAWESVATQADADFKAALEAWIVTPGTNYGLRIKQNNEGALGDVTHYSREFAGGAPKIDLHYNIVPNAPTAFTPTGGIDWNYGAPITANFSDPDAEDTCSIMQILIYEDNGTTLKYDTGSVAPVGAPVANNGTLSRTIPSAAGLTTQTYYKYKVRVQDNHGEWSAYSALQRFFFQPNVSIVFPLAAFSINPFLITATGDVHISFPLATFELVPFIPTIQGISGGWITRIDRRNALRIMLRDWTRTDRLQDPMATSATTLKSLGGQMDIYEKGKVIKINDEEMLCIKIGTNNDGKDNVVTVIRGWNGTPIHSHDGNSVISIFDFWTDSELNTALGFAVNGLWPDIFQWGIDETVTVTPGVYTYPLPATIAGAIGMIVDVGLFTASDPRAMPVDCQMIAGNIYLYSDFTGTLRIRYIYPYQALVDDLAADSVSVLYSELVEVDAAIKAMEMMMIDRDKYEKYLAQQNANPYEIDVNLRNMRKRAQEKRDSLRMARPACMRF